ncbi:hypothetical protein [Pseudomonas sp. TTU2014-080ASC]|uniref:hypothetical protein n=1 Tax=Pseudomonas sp. TTU2014-080ASC TaxID=1729724 RepID=UPI0007183FB1|nr:hypothetical protein [Pseudomonas sp. TTU2014-080ASC]KRW58842.1 hypothetical protein AO726_15105 [Pseudomonas sp. TTU2014-080ASC]
MDIVTGLQLQKPRTWLLLVTVLLAVAAEFKIAKGDADTKVMMHFGGWDVEDTFDASRWFNSGMYKPRSEADGRTSMVTMLRAKPLTFTKDQIQELPFTVLALLRNEFPEINRETYLDNPPDLSKRYRYAYSAFSKPNHPEDYYYLYLELEQRRFVATIRRDAQSGADIAGRFISEVYADQPTDAEHIKVFAEIAEAEHKAR